MVAAHKIDSSRRCANCAHVDPEFECLQLVRMADGGPKPDEFACNEHQTSAEWDLGLRRAARPILLGAVVALAGCGQADEPVAASPAAPATSPAQHGGGDNGLLWGLGGFLLGRATAPSPAPAPAVAPARPAPVYIDRRTVVQAPPPPASPRPAAPPAPVKPPVVSTSPSVPPPAPTAAPKPSYSGPSSYRSVTQSAPSYSRSFSSPSVGRR